MNSSLSSDNKEGLSQLQSSANHMKLVATSFDPRGGKATQEACHLIDEAFNRIAADVMARAEAQPSASLYRGDA